MTTDREKSTERDQTAQAASARRRAMLTGSAGQEGTPPKPERKPTPRPRGHLADPTTPTTDPASARRREMLGYAPTRSTR